MFEPNSEIVCPVQSFTKFELRQMPGDAICICVLPRIDRDSITCYYVYDGYSMINITCQFTFDSYTLFDK